LTMARGPAAGGGRSPGPRAGDKPASRTGQTASRTGQRTDRTGTPQGPRAGQRTGGRGGKGGGGGASRRRIDPARLVAFEVLRAVRERAASATLPLPALPRERGLPGREPAPPTELSYGPLRGRGTYDGVIAAGSARGPGRIDPPVLDVLR